MCMEYIISDTFLMIIIMQCAYVWLTPAQFKVLYK